MNYKALGRDKEAYIALGATTLFTVLLFYILIQISKEILDKAPSFLFTAIYGAIVYIFYHYYMAEEISQAFSEGGKRGSNWSVAGFSILGLLLNLAIIFVIAVDQPFYEGELIEVKGNQLYYNSDVPKRDVDKLVKQFEIQNFFGESYGNIARLELINDEYYITLVVEEALWSDEDIISYLKGLKWLMEDEFGRPTNLKLESVSLTGQSKFKHITD